MNAAARGMGALLFVVVFLAGGCMKPSKLSSKKADSGPNLQPQAIGMKSGSVTAYTKTGPRQPLYSVHWVTASLKSSDPGSFYAVAQSVGGEIMKNGTVASHFTADSAIVDRQKGTLRMTGHVTITQVLKGNTPGAVLHCDAVSYADADQIIKAEGNVQVRTATSSLTGLPAVWATPDFSEIGSPDTGFHH